MHDNILLFQFLPVIVLYMTTLYGIEWRRTEAAI